MNVRKLCYPSLVVWYFVFASLSMASECHLYTWNSSHSVLKPLHFGGKKLEAEALQSEALQAKKLASFQAQMNQFRLEARAKEEVFPLKVRGFLESLPSMDETDYWSIFSPFLKDYLQLRKQTSVLYQGIPARRLADLIIAIWAERYLFVAHPGEFRMEIYAQYWERVQSLGLGTDVIFSFQQAQQFFQSLRLWVRQLDERGLGRNLQQHSLFIYGSSVNARLHSRSDIDAVLFYRGKSGASSKWRSLDQDIPWAKIFESTGLESGLARIIDIRSSTNDQYENPSQVIQFGTKVHPVVVEIRSNRVILHRRGSRAEL